MNEYDQKKSDPQGWYFSLAVICGLFSAGAFMTGGPLTFVGIVAACGAVGFWWKSDTVH